MLSIGKAMSIKSLQATGTERPSDTSCISGISV